MVFDLPGALLPRWTVKLYVLTAALDWETFRRKHIAMTDRYNMNILIAVFERSLVGRKQKKESAMVAYMENLRGFRVF